MPSSSFCEYPRNPYAASLAGSLMTSRLSRSARSAAANETMEFVPFAARLVFSRKSLKYRLRRDNMLSNIHQRSASSNSLGFQAALGSGRIPALPYPSSTGRQANRCGSCGALPVPDLRSSHFKPESIPRSMAIRFFLSNCTDALEIAYYRVYIAAEISRCSTYCNTTSLQERWHRILKRNPLPTQCRDQRRKSFHACQFPLRRAFGTRHLIKNKQAD